VPFKAGSFLFFLLEAMLDSEAKLLEGLRGEKSIPGIE
jgi:hypothetical protein